MENDENRDRNKQRRKDKKIANKELENQYHGDKKNKETENSEGDVLKEVKWGDSLEEMEQKIMENNKIKKENKPRKEAWSKPKDGRKDVKKTGKQRIYRSVGVEDKDDIEQKVLENNKIKKVKEHKPRKEAWSKTEDGRTDEKKLEKHRLYRSVGDENKDEILPKKESILKSILKRNITDKTEEAKPAIRMADLKNNRTTEKGTNKRVEGMDSSVKTKIRTEKEPKDSKKQKKEMERLKTEENKKEKQRKKAETKQRKLEIKQCKKLEKIQSKIQKQIRTIVQEAEEISKKMAKKKEKVGLSNEEKPKRSKVNDRNMEEKLELEKEIKSEIEFSEKERKRMENGKSWITKKIWKKKRNNKVGVEEIDKKKERREEVECELKFAPYYQKQTPSTPQNNPFKLPFNPVNTRETIAAIIYTANTRVLQLLKRGNRT